MKRMQADVDAFLRLELMGHMLTDQRWDGFEHSHPFEELIYVLKGPVTFSCEEKTLVINQGEMMIVPKDLSHRIVSATPASFLYIGLRTSLLDLLEHSLQPFSKDITADVSILAMKMSDMAEKAFADGVSFADFSDQILVFLIPALSSMCKKRVELDQKRILSDKIKQYIKHNYHRPIRVDEIAASLYHTPHYLGNVFAAVNGVTIKEYAMQYKMQRAITLLQNGNYTVSDVAEMVGYESAHYFSKCFKSYYGVSPSTLKSKE